MIPFNLHHRKVELSHVTVNLEKHGPDERALHVTVTLKAMMTVEQVAPLLGILEMEQDAIDRIKAGHWDEDGNHFVDSKVQWKDFIQEDTEVSLSEDTATDDGDRLFFRSTEGSLKSFSGEYTLGTQMIVTFTAGFSVNEGNIADICRVWAKNTNIIVATQARQLSLELEEPQEEGLKLV